MSDDDQKMQKFIEETKKLSDEDINRNIKNKVFIRGKKTEAELILEKRKNDQKNKLIDERLALAKSSSRRSWWAIFLALIWGFAAQPPNLLNLRFISEYCL